VSAAAIGLAGDVRAHRRTLARRRTLVTGALGVVAFVLFLAVLMIGDVWLWPWDVLASATRLRDIETVDFVVRELRLPTALTAVFVGAALGVSGMVFQRLLANPLASPDLVGVSSGASLFAVVAIVFLSLGSVQVSAASLAGALVSCALIYVLAWRDGISGYRFILIGIGISELALSIVGYVIARAEFWDAREAVTWLIGSVGQAGSGELRAVAAAVLVLVPAAMLLGRPLGALELGDDAARALGTRIELNRLALIACAIALVGFATAAAGPILFVALIANPIATRLLGAAGSSVLAAAFTGAIVVLGAELVCDHLLPVELPTGVVTGAIGAPYLLWLLATANREGRGG
jgi:iron complex transport system permease protein